jgi:hypothetical protein
MSWRDSRASAAPQPTRRDHGRGCPGNGRNADAVRDPDGRRTTDNRRSALDTSAAATLGIGLTGLGAALAQGYAVAAALDGSTRNRAKL